MNDITYKVSVLVNGQHSVRIESDDPTIAGRALEWLSQTYHVAPIKRRVDAPSFPAAPQITLPVAPQPVEQPPICSIHQTPMTLVNGKRGQFWSCHNRMANGEWCRKTVDA